MPTSPILGLDIGGTLAKLAVFVPIGHDSSAQRVVSALTSGSGIVVSHTSLQIGRRGKVVFCSFPSEMLKHVHPSDVFERATTLSATGGGAHKFEDDLVKATNASGVAHVGELQALFDGLELLLEVGEEDEVFTCSDVRFAGMIGRERLSLKTVPLLPPLRFKAGEGGTPEGFLVVNIGSGVSFVDCVGDGTFVRVGGSSLGGAAFLGLATLLCGVDSFEEALTLAATGDSTNVDLLVGDIYSDGAETNKRLEDLGLRASTLAASFGKMANSKKARDAVKPGDLALATLIMVALNLAALTYLHAVARKRSVVLFVGSFLGSSAATRNTLACRTLSYGIEYWAQARSYPMRAAFLKHEGFLGSLGALAGEYVTPYTFTTNMTTSLLDTAHSYYIHLLGLQTETLFHIALFCLCLQLCLGHRHMSIFRLTLFTFGGSTAAALCMGKVPFLFSNPVGFPTLLLARSLIEFPWFRGLFPDRSLSRVLLRAGTEVCRVQIATTWTRNALHAGWPVIAQVLLGAVAGSFGFVAAYASLRVVTKTPAKEIFLGLCVGLSVFLMWGGGGSGDAEGKAACALVMVGWRVAYPVWRENAKEIREGVGNVVFGDSLPATHDAVVGLKKKEI